MNKYVFPFLILFFWACSSREQELPSYAAQTIIFPDYRDVTIPRTIAPLTFHVNTDEKQVNVCFRAGSYETCVKGKEIVLSDRKWKKLLLSGDTVVVDIRSDNKSIHSFNIYVSPDEIDSYLAYRSIEPGYELWGKMGIYQRCLSDYEETPVYENSSTLHVCVNCHTPYKGNPEQFIFHQRPKPSGTILVKDGKNVKLDTDFNEKIKALVYPSWHPSGEYIAFSVNTTKQSVHSVDRNRIEVMDMASDVVILNLKTNKLLTASSLMSDGVFETFPSFSPDGKTLYFCSAKAVTLPDSIRSVKYDLCSLSIDVEAGTFGQRVDTIVHASKSGYSVSFPRISPDGRFLLYTKHAYGNFSIWHRDADLCMYDLEKKENVDVGRLNSPETESYHTWSSNGRWIVFSSRRIDGLYTSPFLAHVDSSGRVGKPFILPQKQSDYYVWNYKSFNIPEFMTGKIKDRRKIFSKLIQ